MLQITVICQNITLAEFLRQKQEVSLYAFIKRLKMEQSALRLKLEKDKFITDIGVDFGYSSSNYSSAFKKHHNISPAEFQKSMNMTCVPHPFYLEKIERFQSFEEYDQQITIKDLIPLSPKRTPLK